MRWAGGADGVFFEKLAQDKGQDAATEVIILFLSLSVQGAARFL